MLVSLFAALSLYQRVAKASPNGQRSIAVLERLFPEWGDKMIVLVLVGFAATEFSDQAATLSRFRHWRQLVIFTSSLNPHVSSLILLVF